MMQLQTGSTVKKKNVTGLLLKRFTEIVVIPAAKKLLFTSSLVRTSKVHSLYSLMIARGSYEYKATSSHYDLTPGGQAAFWVSVELLKARGHFGGAPVSATSFCTAMHPCIPPPFHSFFLASQPVSSPGVPADMSGNRTVPHFLSAWGQGAGFFFSPLYSFHFKTFPNLF